MNIISITDIQAPELEVYTKLNESQLKHYYEPNGGIFIAESPAVISLALDAGFKPLSLLTTHEDITGECKDVISRLGDTPVYSVTKETVDSIRGFHLIRGAMCAMRRKPTPSLETILSNCSRVAVLDNVQNPTNVGAIIRSAAAMHVDAVVITDNSSDPLYRRAARVSMGTVFQIPWTMTDNTYLETLKALGFKTAALALDDNCVPIDDPVLCDTRRLALILGSEGYGLSQDIIKKCDYTVKIPMSHGVDSLNVAAAAAVAFWQVRKK